ncbi:Ankyrin-1 [Araneus ventricosus]|uniref:Alpha-latrotoxin n=1 Tax=Araneus ventricosus TaxID=182803 RepID=A0A4Y2KDL5_ARAVE|nr:Ankyrin-1 [Araneus ventricosus]
MARYRQDYNLLSLSAESCEFVINEYNDLDEVSAKILYIDVLKAVKGVISDGKIDCLMNLSLVLKEIGKFKKDECLENYKHSDGIGSFNLVSLACKNKAIKVLRYIYSDESQTLHNLSSKISGVRKKESLMSAKDEFCHHAFYYAIRSNMTDLLSFLVDKWQSQYGDESLDDLLSQSYKELKLRNVSLTTEMQLFVHSKLLELRFFHASTSGSSETGNSWEEIKKRIELVVRYIKSIKNDYWNRDPDEKFIFIAEFIAKNIHVLKYLLKSTYDRLPWEEIEFCLTIFIKCCKNSSEPNLVYNSVLNKKQLLSHLLNFSAALDSQHHNFENSNVMRLAKSVKLPRDSVIDNIIKENSKFRKLYDDYEKIRDFCSLEIIESYADLIESRDATEERRHLLVSRVLQVMGEHLKNTLDSPKLSTKTAEALLSSLSLNTRNIITKLRDSLSHEESLLIRSEIEKKAHLFKNLPADISKIKNVITNMLYVKRIAFLKNLMQKMKLCDTFEGIRDLYGPFHYSVDLHRQEMENTFLKTSFKGDLERLEELISRLDKNLNDKSLSEKSLFDRIHYLIRREKAIFENIILANRFSTAFHHIVYNYNQFYSSHRLNFMPDMVDIFSEISTSEIPLEKMQYIEAPVRKLLGSVLSRIVPSGNQKVYGILCSISYFLNFEMGSVKWIEEFRDIVSENTIRVNQSLSENLLTSKFSLLKESLIDFDLKNGASSADLSSFVRNPELRAVTEMLILDILCILESSCSRNPFFLDSYLPLITGRNLRNHLAHGNTLLDVCLEENCIQLLINAKKILTAVWPKNNKKMDRVIKCDCTKLQSSIEDDLRIISCQQKLFVALGEGNMKDVEECVREGADVYGKDCNLWTCLHFAGKAPDIAAVEWILKQGVDINAKSTAAQTVLHIAAKFNGIELVRFLVELQHISLEICDSNGKTPLHVAVENQSNDVVKYISELEISTTRKDKDGFTPLHTAIYRQNTDAAKILLEKETNVDENKWHINFTPLHIATMSEDLDLVELLIAKKASADSRCDFGNTSLHLATLKGNYGIVKVLVANSADVNAENEAGSTPLHNAAASGSTEAVEVLLEHGSDINKSDHIQYTPLMSAAKCGHASIAELLFQKGALVNSKNDIGLTPLHFAAQMGHCGTVELLINYKAIIDFKSNKNLTALHLSAVGGHKEVVKLLLKEGADINATESTNSTPLHLAAAGGHKDIVDLLLDEGACVDWKNEREFTALHIAALNADRGIAESLLKKGADIQANDANKDTPTHILIARGLSDLLTSEERNFNFLDVNGYNLLHLAALFGDQMLVEYCIENNFDIHARSNSGLTALHLAADSNHQKVVSFLLQKGAEIGAVDEDGDTPFYFAAKNNCRETVKILVSHEIPDLKPASDDKIKALIHSVCFGRSDIVDILFKNYKFDINNELKTCLLIAAVCNNHKYIMATLLERGFEIDGDARPLHDVFTNKHHDLAALLDKGFEIDGGSRPLRVAVNNKHYEMVEFLLAKGANPNLPDEKNLTPLHIAAIRGDAEMLDIFLSQKADIRIESEVILLAAKLAVLNNQLDVIKRLLQLKFIDINFKGSGGNTWLHSSARSGSLDVTRYLVAEGADINAKYGKDCKPVHIAAERGFKDMVEFYLNCNDLEDETAELLLRAACNGKANVCELLLERNPDVNKIHSNVVTSMHFALLKGHKDVLRVFLHCGSYYNSPLLTLLRQTKDNDAASLLRKVKKLFTFVQNNAASEVETLFKAQSISEYCIANAKCVKKETVLHYASWKGYNEIVEILLKYNADPNARTKTGYTPLHYAAKFSHFSIVRALLSNGAMYNAISQTGKTPLDCAADRKIRDFFLFLKYIFKKVQDNDPSVLENLIGKDEGVMRAVIRAKNQEGNTLLDVAHICDFAKSAELQMLFETDVYSDLVLAAKFEFEGRYAEAFSAYECVVKKRLAIFGPCSHPVLDAKFKLAELYKTQQKFDKALDLFKDIHHIRKEKLGELHKETLFCETHIGLVLLEQEKKQEALNIFKTVYFRQKEKFDDFNAILNEIGLRTVLYEMNKFEEALKIIMEFEEKYSQKKDELWPVLTDLRFSKSEILKSQGKYPEALELFKDQYKKRKYHLTPHHPYALDALSKVALVLFLQKKFDESLKVYRKVLDIQRCNLPEDHIEILKTEFYIGDVLVMQQMLVAALKMFLSLERRIAAVEPDSDLMKANKHRLEILKDTFSSIGLQCTFERIQNRSKQPGKKP